MALSAGAFRSRYCVIELSTRKFRLIGDNKSFREIFPSRRDQIVDELERELSETMRRDMMTERRQGRDSEETDPHEISEDSSCNGKESVITLHAVEENHLQGAGENEQKDISPEVVKNQETGHIRRIQPLQTTILAAEIDDRLYMSILIKVQPQSCRQIIAAWLRRCHPKKSDTHSYKRHTAPDYWPRPENCRHLILAKLSKEELLVLIIHLLHADRKFVHARFPIHQLETVLNKNIAMYGQERPDLLHIRSALIIRKARIRYENGEPSSFLVEYPMPPILPGETSSRGKQAQQRPQRRPGLEKDTEFVPVAPGDTWVIGADSTGAITVPPRDMPGAWEDTQWQSTWGTSDLFLNNSAINFVY